MEATNSDSSRNSGWTLALLDVAASARSWYQLCAAQGSRFVGCKLGAVVMRGTVLMGCG